MTDYLETERRGLKRKRRERYLIVLLIVVISLLSYLGIRVLDLGLNLPFSGSILVFALININVILLLLLLFLIVRNVVKLLFERKKEIMGAKLRTKLVLAFVTLTLLPTIILFFVSVQFISSSVDYWSNLQIEQSLKNSLDVGRDYYNRSVDQVLFFGNKLSRVIRYKGFLLASKKKDLEKFIDEKRKEYSLASLKVFGRDLILRTVSRDDRIDLLPFERLRKKTLRNVIKRGTDDHVILSSAHGDLICGIVPVFSRTETKAVVGLIVLSKFVPRRFENRLKAIARGLQEYQQLKMLKRPIKISNIITLSIVTLLIIFSSIWFGFYLSKEITIPIRELAEATNRIASGDYDFYIDLESKDEIGGLVNSFNKMTMDLKISKNQLEQANRDLIQSNEELEQRRLYMEFVLANVAAGVISADEKGNILTINKSAETMLETSAADIIGKNYREVLANAYSEIIDGFLKDKALLKKGFLKKQIRVSAGNRNLSLLISINALRDDKRHYIGFVAVFEDLSDIEKAHRMAAWREVARRIAHEVKNPLTPIQLSAQRLRKRYGDMLQSGDGRVFHDCTEMIIRQVEELKGLVNEFSNFARMPAVDPAPADISQIIKEAMSIYNEAHKDVNFVFNDSDDVPVFNLDRKQIKRVMINLLDNGLKFTPRGGRVWVTAEPRGEDLRVEVVDNGPGIPPRERERIFEKFTQVRGREGTRRGSGLGLAFCRMVMEAHGGRIWVEEGPDGVGSRFVLTLPLAGT